MKKTTKAVLLSALVYPGLGQLVFKRYLSATILVAMASMSLYYLVASTLERVLPIVEKIQRGEIAPDLEVIAELVAQQSRNGAGDWVTLATLALLLSWLIGIFDSYRLGRADAAQARDKS